MQTNSHCSAHHSEHQSCHGSAASPPVGVWYQNRLFKICGVVLLLWLASYYAPALSAWRNAFWMYFKAVWLAVLAGLLLGGIIDHYIPREYISQVLAQRKKRTVFYAVGLGFLASVCSHGILALAIQLHKKGASGPAVVSFLLAAPWANFPVTFMMFGFFGWKAFLFILSAILIAIISGFVFQLLDARGLIEKNANFAAVEEGFSIAGDIKARFAAYRFGWNTLKTDFLGIISGAINLADMILWWIVFGLLLASLSAAFIPAHIFHAYLGPTFLGLLVTLAFATIIEVCSEGSAPLAFEIFRQTGALGNSFVFLMAGVVTDYTEIGLLWANVGRKTALWLPVVCVPQVVLLGWAFNLLS
jgi:uncharacterized membrane protein YraQ (UPF0718 family)